MPTDFATPKMWDTAWDSRGTATQFAVPEPELCGTAKIVLNQQDDTAVPVSHTLGARDSGTLPKMWDTAWDSRGTALWQRPRRAAFQTPRGR